MFRKLFLLFGSLAALSACGGSDGSGIPPLESPPVARAAAYYSWMHPEVERAWGDGYLGAGARITVVDDFRGPSFSGGLTGDQRKANHGAWVETLAGLVAPEASVVSLNYEQGRRIALSDDHLNVVNLSYGLIFSSSSGFGGMDWTSRSMWGASENRTERDIIRFASENAAVIVKAAGNEGIEVDGIVSTGSTHEIDGLNMALIGMDSAIFVGALNRNGRVGNRADLADYSNFAGENPTVQDQFLTVGVDSARMGGLAGTSFAAPIVSGYAAILGSKFTGADPSQIAEQLLNTARTDTIRNYDPAVHGRGEASIRRALAPAEIR